MRTSSSASSPTNPLGCHTGRQTANATAHDSLPSGASCLTVLVPSVVLCSRRRGERKSTVHWGQRKLLLSEIEFLTLYSEPGITVVYAGAAPGTHIGYLSRLFPEVSRFVLVDPSPFTCQPSDRIVVRNEYMTTEVRRG